MHANLDAMNGQGAVMVRYPVRQQREAWVLPEGPVPESTTHDAAVREIWMLLDAWVKRTGLDALVVRNLAVRWLPDAPRVGIDPDVALIDPAPAESALSSLRVWEHSKVPPRLCFEVVSESHPYKDYATLQDRYAAMGTLELVVFDPMLCGPASLGGPVAIQVWRRDALGVLERVHFGDGPAFSVELDAWLHAEGRQLRICDAKDGSGRWLNGEEQLRAQNEQLHADRERERAEKERERAEKEAALERIAALERRVAAVLDGKK